MTIVTSDSRPLLDWPDTLVDMAAFRREQAQLARVWSFLGHTHDIPRDGDWFRTDLATRSIFVQRFGKQLRAFENRCAHRSFPLRTADKGNGPVICGFHHWRYDAEGRAVEIPQCEQLFHKTPQEMGATLTPIEVACCGPLIFGRFRAPGDDETLEQFLGDGFPIIEALWREGGYSHFMTREVQANWRLCVQITVEEYHVPAVHPPYWGVHGYLKREAIGYFRFGRHSAYITNPEADAFTRMAAECRAGTWRSANYRVFHVFPGFAVAHARADREHWYVSAMQFQPIAPDRTRVRYWACPSPFPSAVPPSWYDRVLDRFAFNRWLRDLIVRYYSAKIQAQDTAMCETLQTIARQNGPAPVLGQLEERIGWFEEAYAQAMAAAIPARTRNAAK